MTVAEQIPTMQTPVTTNGREEWLHAVKALMSQVTEWSHSQGWDVFARGREANRDFSYEEQGVSIIEIDAHPQDARSGSDVKLILEPMTYNSVTGTGRVDFYVWPALYRVRLLHKSDNGEWIIRTDSGLDWPLPWNQETFTQIVHGLLRA